MTAVYFFSGAGHSRAVAEHLAGGLGCPLIEMEKADGSECASVSVVVFPVYSDNIPVPVKVFLKGLDYGQVALIAVFGRMSHGNVLTQAAKLCRGKIICGAYIPTGHTYLGQGAEFDRTVLAPVIERIRNPVTAILPREHQSLPGMLAPEARARMMVRIVPGADCGRCGACTAVCPVHSMKNGRTGRDCLRCLRCVDACPRKALSVRYSPILKRYLRRPRLTEAEIYL